MKMDCTNTFTFETYFNHIQRLLIENKATGGDQSLEHIEATKINVQRIKRINKTGKIHDSIQSVIKANQPDWSWTLIVESWCGDAAQIIPYIYKASECADSIDLKIILRDENPEIIDQFLTNNGRAIPILICRDGRTNEVIGHWGPRPKNIIKWIVDYKAENTDFEPATFNKDLHLFYARDKGKGINEAIRSSVEEWLKRTKRLI
jgi:hypothetical protein